MTGKRGNGRIFQRKGSAFMWCAYYLRGKEYRESTGELWSSEEGPQGGDEVNLIKAGKNYGWPLAGLGRNYDGSII